MHKCVGFFVCLFFHLLAKQSSSIKLLWKKVLLSVAHSCSLKERKLTEAFKTGSAMTTVEVPVPKRFISWHGPLP